LALDAFHFVLLFLQFNFLLTFLLSQFITLKIVNLWSQFKFLIALIYSWKCFFRLLFLIIENNSFSNLFTFVFRFMKLIFLSFRILPYSFQRFWKNYFSGFLAVRCFKFISLTILPPNCSQNWNFLQQIIFSIKLWIPISYFNGSQSLISLMIPLSTSFIWKIFSYLYITFFQCSSPKILK
jgi:hypothetical protein